MANEAKKAETQEAAKVTNGGRSGKPATDKNAVVELLRGNTKRGESQKRYAHYKNGMTVGEYVEKAGSKGMPDIRWDQEHGFIKLHPAGTKLPSKSPNFKD
jgi:hypothetical protein